MNWRSPTGPLVHEHRVIDRMIALMQAHLESIARQGRADPGFVGVATDFIHSYADRCHHGKEEDILFRGLDAKDLDAQLRAAMEDLIRDHAKARALTADLGEANARYVAGEEDALEAVTRAMKGLVELYPVHVAKEERHFFRECLRYLSSGEQAEMLRQYAEFDAGLIHEKYRGIVERLEEARAGVIPAGA